MNNRTEQKLTDLSGMEKAVKDILKQAWIRGVRYGIEQSKEDIPKGNLISRDYPFYAEAYQTGYEEGKNERQQGEWYEEQFTSCGSILQMRLNVIQQRCSKCERWSIKWEGTIPSNYCSHCGARMRKGGAE